MMCKWYRCVLVLAGLLVMVPASRAQDVYAGVRSTRIQVGAGVMRLSSDYVDKPIYGISGWADYDFRKWLGIEADVHIGTIITPEDLGENSYLIGPRFVYRKKALTGFGRVTAGRGTIINQAFNLSTSFNILAVGGGAEYLVKRKFNIRFVDFEYQDWYAFKPHSLSPISITAGVSYVIR